MSVSVKTSHLAPARFSKISFGLTETHPRDRAVACAGGGGGSRGATAPWDFQFLCFFN